MAAVTHPDRIVFPQAGTTKGDVVAYYERMSARILPHVLERPLTLRRFPKGVGQPGFFQKNVPPHYPASIGRFEVPRREGVTVYPVVSEAEHLAYLANQGAIELHVPCARVPDGGRPDRIVIDLDPPPGALDLVRRAAHLVREDLDRLGLPSVPVATGSKGYHVVAPIRPSLDAEAIAIAVQQLAALLTTRHEDSLTTVFRVANRGGKVFVDWLRNMPQATVVVPYSLRARARPSVATPIEWTELDTTAPDAFSLADAELLAARTDPLAALAAAPADPAPFVKRVGDAFEAAGLVLERFDRFRS